MQYDFDTVIDRRHTNSEKYDSCEKLFGREDVIPLWVADMDFRTAPAVLEAVRAKAELGIWGYTLRPDSCFRAVADWQRRRNGWNADPALFSWAPGVVPALSVLIRTFTRGDDGVLIQTPAYMGFFSVIRGSGRRVVESPLREENGRWSMDFADLERKLPGVRMFILCSPHNPVGVVWTREDLERVTELCFRYNVLLVSDEIHSDLIFWGKRHIPAASVSPEAAGRVVTCTSGSKTFNLAGLQACTIILPDAETKKRFDAFWTDMDFDMSNAFSSEAMEAAFTRGEDWLEALKKYLEGNFLFLRDYCARYIPAIRPNVPDGTYLVWLDCRALGLGERELRDFMIREAGLGLNDGTGFGREYGGYMRLNAACPRSVLEKAMAQLRAAVEKLGEKQN